MKYYVDTLQGEGRELTGRKSIGAILYMPQSKLFVGRTTSHEIGHLDHSEAEGMERIN